MAKQNVAPTRLELVTLGLLDLRSNQLSYGADLYKSGSATWVTGCAKPEFPTAHTPAKSPILRPQPFSNFYPLFGTHNA